MDKDTCYNPSQNTVLSGLEFGGVPMVLLLNFIVFLVLVIIFSIIRKTFWDYGRLALVADNEGSVRRSRFCSWLPYILRMDEEKIKSRCGMDAIHYLSFQRHLLFLLFVITVTSLGVILPVNMTGDLLSGNDLLWLHTVFAVLYLILTVLLLRRHTSRMKDRRRETTRNSLFVCSLPKTATEEDIKTHFTEAYPTCQVCDVTLAYDVAKLMHLDKERLRAGKNLRYYERILEKTEKPALINPRLCGHLCCCSNVEKVDAIEYYSTKEKELLVEVRKQAEEVPQHPLGLAFITLQNEAMAKYILKDFNALECDSTSCCSCCGREPQPSTNSKALRVNKWQVSFAPHPRNVAMTLHVALFHLQSPIISQFFPTLLLWSFSALLPTMVYYSTLGESHWSRSSEQLSMMRKLYFFLLFMVLILPSLGLTSLDVFFRWLFDKTFLTDGKMRFECVFLPNQGAFFVNYVIAAALVGSGMELLRLPGLLLYIIRMMLARSAAERKYVRQNQAYEFEYGAMYGWTLCVFTVVMAYSIICPVIVPFGLLYMLLKHLVDRHNLYFAYLPTRLTHQVHLGAVNQALAAPIICLIWLYFFSVLRAGQEQQQSRNGVYLPRVLNPKSPVDSPQRSKPQRSYGSMDEIPAPEPSPVEEDASEA
uniref:Transmembrane protein 63A n=1 Tax=Acanthochromis polyacanthus TaxID=80966 RepID=A0A3Q1EEN2_9TELE